MLHFRFNGRIFLYHCYYYCHHGYNYFQLETKISSYHFISKNKYIDYQDDKNSNIEININFPAPEVSYVHHIMNCSVGNSICCFLDEDLYFLYFCRHHTFFLINFVILLLQIIEFFAYFLISF